MPLRYAVAAVTPTRVTLDPGMIWPRTGGGIALLEDRLRHESGTITAGDLLNAAAVIAAYRSLVHARRDHREAACAALREAEASAARSAP